MNNNKMRFVSRQDGEGEEKENELFSLQIKFVPGQIVYLVENGEILKSKIVKVAVKVALFENDVEQTRIVYVLSHSEQSFLENQLYEQIAEIPIRDKTHTIRGKKISRENFKIEDDGDLKEEVNKDLPF